jgi:YHS domain-containing protein
VQDPQCGTYLPKSRALMIGSGDDAKYFCSPACRDAYTSSPTSQASSPKPHATSVR